MTNVYDFSFDEFEKYIENVKNNTKKNTGVTIAESNKKKKFSSLEEIDEYYNSSNAVEFFKNELLS